MSTKTSIKRIALVAVSALGFGVLSMVPASAATTSAALVSKPAVTRAGAAVTLQIVGERIGDADANGQWISQATSVPAGAGIELNDKMVNAEADSDSGEDKTMTLGRAAGSIGIVAKLTADGTAVCRTTANLIADAVTAVDAGALGSTNPTSLSQIYWANDGTAYVYADDDDNAGAGKAWVKVVGAAHEYTGSATGGTTGDACSLETDTNVGFDAGSYAAGASATITFGALNVSVANRTYSATGDYFSVAGDYTFRTWWEEDNDQILDGDEKYFDATVSLGGTPASFTLTPVQTSQVAAVNIEIRVAVLDSGNRPTTLSGAEEIIVVPSTLTGTNDDKFDDDSDASNGSTSSESFTGADNVVAGKDYYLGAAHKATAGTMSLSANFTGALLALATPVTSGTLTFATEGTATSIAVSSGETLVSTSATKYVAPVAHKANSAIDLYASITNTSIPFTISGTAGDVIKVTIAAADGATPGDVVAGTYNVTIGSDGTATYTVTDATPADTEDYNISVTTAAGTSTFDVNYSAAAVHDDGITISPNIEATNVTTSVVAPASTNSWTVTVKDQYGTAYNNYTVRIVTGSTQRNASKTVNATTDANGVAVVSLTDASTSTTNTTDLVEFNVFAPGSAADLENAQITLKYSSDATALYTLTLTGGTTATATVTRPAPTTEILGLPASVAADSESLVALTSALKDAVTTAAVNGILLTYTGTDGVKFLEANNGNEDDGVTSLALASNTTAVWAYATKAGTHTVTVTGPTGLVKTQTFTVTGTASAARDVAIAAASSTYANNVVGKVNATITDGFGNPLKDVTVNFTRSGVGRFAGGASTTTATTDASGVATAEIVANVGETGEMTVSASLPVATYAQANDEAEDPVVAFTEASGAKSAVVTWTAAPATKSAEVLAAEAAEAEAKKATAEAAAATAAAKAAGDAAVAAAKAAEVAAKKAADDAVAAAKAAGDAAVAAAVKAALDAVAAAKAAQDAAVAQASEAYDASLEAIDAANAATDAANLAQESADAATVAAEEARDAADAATAAVEELATQMSTLFASLKAQITTLGNTVAKIAKKVKA